MQAYLWQLAGSSKMSSQAPSQVLHEGCTKKGVTSGEVSHVERAEQLEAIC